MMTKRAVLLAILCALLIAAIPTLAQEPLVSLGSSEELGSYLVGPNGMTLYSLTPDEIGESVCYDQCATAWPPLTVASADELSAAEGIPGTLGTTERTDGTLQVTYNGIPLYYWFRDAAVGDTTGHRVNNVWWIVPPATVYTQRVPDLGTILVGPTGLSLYLFTRDTAGDGLSTCYDNCAVAWPPLLVDSAESIVPGVNLPGELSTIERTDGTLQVAYNGWPLYYWKDDVAVGDALGEGANSVWYTISPETVAVASSEALGDYLVATNGMTLYLFTNDAAGVSNCSGGCAENWPPYTLAEGERLASSPNAAGELTTFAREDGSMQVAYNGVPLYFWKDDAVPGDTTGHEVGGVWFIVEP
ncbi:MAG: hypothetical protein IPK52_03120 [Chloroflexi bacterium]|nr:hypothetical protein [Chloroflexota bacterium]